MIPTINDSFLLNFEDRIIESKDYYLNQDNNRIQGTVEDIEQVKQSVYLMLNTERYDYVIYPWEYGVELTDLVGQPFSYVIPEVERRVTECLLQDDRILSVNEFDFEREKNKLHVTFNVSTKFGAFNGEVNVNV